MEFLTRRKCPECDGEGVVVNPRWQAFFQSEQEQAAKLGRQLNSEEYDKAVLDFFGTTDSDGLPSEEPTCSTCEGAKVIQEWRDAEELFTPPNVIG